MMALPTFDIDWPLQFIAATDGHCHQLLQCFASLPLDGRLEPKIIGAARRAGDHLHAEDELALLFGFIALMEHRW